MFEFAPDNYRLSQAWLRSPPGQAFVRHEREVLARMLPGLTGYRCIQIGPWGAAREVLEQAGTLCQWRLGLGDTHEADVRFDGRRLPLASHSLDALILAHSLEAVARPHALLRECERVLNDRGQLLVLAFNPLSLWALRQRLPAWRTPRFAFCSRPRGAARLCDWLRLLELEPEQVWRYGLGFPFFGRARRMGAAPRWLRAIAWSAQAYALVARRHVAPRTPVFIRAGQRRAVPAAGWARGAGRRVA